MTPAAVLAHHVAGRTRFRVPGKRGDSGYFATLAEHLGQCPGVLSVTTNPLTTSVLVVHEAADPDVLVAYARTFELFETAAAVTADSDDDRPPGEVLVSGLQTLDDWVRSETKQKTDLRSVALTGLIGAAIWQLLRGQTLPAAATLIWYALTVASDDRRRLHASHEHHTSESDSHEEVRSSAK